MGAWQGHSLLRHSGQAKREPESRVPCTTERAGFPRFAGMTDASKLQSSILNFLIFGALTQPNVLWLSTIS